MISHTDLCGRALKWLYNTAKCEIAVTEISNIAERPDAFGWRYDRTVMIECKVTREDFLRDKKKWYRENPAQGLGNYRFYMCPPDLIKIEDLPPRWGLLYVTNKTIKKIKFPSERGYKWDDEDNFKQPANKELELILLLAIARRLKDNCPYIKKRLGVPEVMTIYKQKGFIIMGQATDDNPGLIS